MPVRSTYQVLIRGLEAYAYHGVPDHEQKTGHRYRVQIEMTVEGSADVTDDVADTVDYAKVSELALKVLTGGSCRTIERVAGLIGDALLHAFPSIVRVSTVVEKPFPPAPVIAEAMAVQVDREREP